MRASAAPGFGLALRPSSVRWLAPLAAVIARANVNTRPGSEAARNWAARSNAFRSVIPAVMP